MLIPWSEKHETYKIYIQDYGYQYFLPDALEAIPETVADILGGLNLKIDAQFERKGEEWKKKNILFITTLSQTKFFLKMSVDIVTAIRGFIPALIFIS